MCTVRLDYYYVSTLSFISLERRHYYSSM